MQEDQAEDGLGRRALVGGGIALAVLLLIILLLFFGGRLKTDAPPDESTATATSAPETANDKPAGTSTEGAAAPPAPANPPPPRIEAAPQDETEIQPPTFDVARIAAEGTAVLAGRAPAGSKVEIIGNGDLIGATDAQRGDGAWVLVVEEPLPEGSLELSLVAVLADGSRIPSREVVLVDVPLRRRPDVPMAEGKIEGKPADAPVAIVTGRAPDADAGPTRILQGPDAAPPASTDKPDVNLDLVEYGPDGAPVLSGRAPAGTIVRLYLDDAPLAETPAGDDGTWRVTPERPVSPGRYRLRLDALDEAGKVVARREVPFERARADVAVAAGSEGASASPSNFTVQPGNSLWRIARERFGDGFRYIDIYRANEGQIRDPDLIYPGQVLELPPPQ